MATSHQASRARVGARSAGAASGDPAREQLREAFLAMTRSLPKRPHWAFHEVASRLDRAPVFHQTVRAIEAAIDAGAPLEDALAWVNALDAHVRRQYLRGDARPMSCLLLEETRADAEADLAQADAFVEASPASLHRVVVTAERQMERLRDLAYYARLHLLLLAHTKMPRLALARAGRGGVRHPEPTTPRTA